MQHTEYLASFIIAAIVVAVIIVLLMINIFLTVVGIVCCARTRSKNDHGSTVTLKGDATDPNPVHYSNQGIYSYTESQQQVIYPLLFNLKG